MTDQSTKILCAFVAGAFVGAFIGKMYYEVESSEEQEEPTVATIEDPVRYEQPEKPRKPILVETASYERVKDPPSEYKGDDMDISTDAGVEIVSSDEMNDGYESIALTYYTADDILVDDMDMPVDNVKNLLGDKFYDFVEENMEDTLYIRNDKLKSIFEVSIVHGHFDWASPHE